jgi:hypothetical protein
MANVKEHKVIITTDSYDINRYILDGWYVLSVTAQHVSAGAGSYLKGAFCFVLER